MSHTVAVRSVFLRAGITVAIVRFRAVEVHVEGGVFLFTELRKHLVRVGVRGGGGYGGGGRLKREIDDKYGKRDIQSKKIKADCWTEKWKSSGKISREIKRQNCTYRNFKAGFRFEILRVPQHDPSPKVRTRVQLFTKQLVVAVLLRKVGFGVWLVGI